MAIARAGDGGGGVVARAVLDGSKSQVHKDSTVTVEDSAFFNATAIGVDTGYSVQNVITLKINEASPIYMRTAFTAHVTLSIAYSNGNDTASMIKTFTVTYDTGQTYNARNNFVFYGGRKVTVKVLNVDVQGASWDVASVLMVENQLTARPKYTFSCSSTVTNITVTSPAANADELPVSWTAIRGADQYDLEWTFIDTSALKRYRKNNGAGDLDPVLIFYNNATRVSTTGNSYNIPLMYDNNGILFIRVRPVQLGKGNSVIAAVWSSDASSSGLGQYNFTGHERLLNWQSSISFAEEGKRKVVVQYFDGSLRSRQTVTKDNTNNKTIAAETFYDYQGRPAIQVMPAPSLQNVIQYTAGFNRSINNPEYYKSDYDSLYSPDLYCNAHAKEMQDNSGASYYYSANNPNKTNGMNQFIPNAEKYPFTETEYTPDNTGRISRQGGVGKDFQLGSGHETKYFYGSPDQGELDALFGTDVGDHSHYFKNMVQDANGQFSISYADMHGRTIATGLAGVAPTSMAPLPSYDSIDVTENLVDSGSRFLENWSMINQKSLLVSAAGNFAFNYKLDPASLIEKGCDTQHICYTCLYDLQITVTDNCNNQTLPGGKPYEKTLRNFSFGSITPSCNPSPMTLSFNLPLKPGNYQITKRLTVSRDGFNYYRDSVYMPNNTCRSMQDFINEQRSIIAQTSQDCIPDCAKCRTSVGTLAQFKANFISQAKIPADEVASYTNQINAAYQNAIEGCNTLCGDSASADNDIRNAMLQDMTPPYGQYADTLYKKRSDKFSIFWVDPEDSLSFIPVFQLDEVNYLDAAGQSDKVYNANSDMLVAPNSLNRTEFTQNFRSSWAEALLPYHPEYCKLKELEKLRPSNLWDRQMEAVENYRDALADGYLNPTQLTDDPKYIFGSNDNNLDPFISIHPEFKKAIEDRLKKYVKLNNGWEINIWALANIVTKCNEGNTPCVDYYNNNKSYNFDTTWCDGDLDMAWIAFRNLYLQVKQEFVNQVVKNPKGCTPVSPVNTVMPTRAELVKAEHQPEFNDDIKTVLSETEPKLDYAGDPNQVNQGKAEAQRQLSEQYKKNVDVLAGQWYDQLAPCYAMNGNDLRDVIIPLLKQLCLKACDPGHLFGASSLPGTTVLEGTTYHSFKDIIDGYNSTHGIASDSIACSADNITVPAPYDKQPIYFNKPVYGKPADCECAVLNGFHAQYLGLPILQRDASFAAFLKRTQDTTLSNENLQLLLNACNNTVIPGESGNACTFLKTPILLPPALQCNSADVCTNCIVVNDLYHSFKQQYPNDTPRVADTDDTIQVKKNIFFQNYMNNRLGFSKQTWEYLQFLRQCSDSAERINTIHYCTDQRIGNLYETASNENGKLQDIQPNFEGGYIMAGAINGPISREGALIKTDSLGNKIWSVTYGGLGSDTLLRVRPTTDNGYIAIGTTHSGNYATGAMWILKVDGNGNKLWTKTIGFSTPFGEHGYDIIQTSDGGYAALGIYNQHAGHGEFLLSRLQSNGTISWVRRFGTSRLQNNSTVCIPDETDSISYNGVPSYGLLEQDDTLLVSGAAYDPNLGDRYFGVIHRINKNTGKLMGSWHYADGTDTTRSCWFRDIYATQNGYMVMVNSAQQLGTVNAQAGVIHLTRTGDIVSYKRFNIPAGSNRMVTSSVFPANDGGYMVAQTGNNSTHVIWQRVDASGTLLWSNETALTGTQTIGRIAQNNNGRFTLAGDNNQKMLMLVLRPDANCYNQNVTLGATDEPVSRVPWAIDVDEWVSPLYTDINLMQGALMLTTTPLVCSGDGHCYDDYTGPTLCGRSEPVLPPLEVTYDGACADSTFFAVSKGTELYKVYVDSLTGAFERNYTEKCLQAYRYESFTVTYTKREYHYTLYYYDQAGNLIRTVPPAGVHMADTAQVRLARQAGTALVPAHTLYTDYRYNTLNQVVAQHTPDGGTSAFWYDRLGRLSISQNAKQEDSAQYSYTKYDDIGRITEVGQITSGTGMNDVTSRDQQSLKTWLTNGAGTAGQITQTTYDAAYFGTNALAWYPTNLRNRVGWTALYNTASDLSNITYAAATHYSYDILGNVDTLLQDYRFGVMNDNSNRLKKIVYNYDLVSGKVNQVSYQPGEKDAFYHRYVYDAENRITHVLTSADSVNWDNDAFYQYYDHGPLARTVIGEQQVQGINYAYNLQGWLKSINPAIYDSTGYTLKADGSTGTVVGKTAYNVMLNYFNGDYKAISGTTPWDANINGTLGSQYRPLYNGNISSMAVNVGALNNPLLYNYQYDQLNRLVAMDAWKKTGTAWSNLTPISDFGERVKYDANGNILSYIRNGNTTGGKQLEMDRLAYNYKPGTNQLDYVYDTVPAGNYDVDIDAQTAGNYEYDPIGNLIKNTADSITSINWTVYGKISRIKKDDGTVIIYTYGTDGNRISKSIIKNGGADTTTTWYVRDATGNVMSVYESGKPSVNVGHLTQSELHLYGSSRVGLLRRSLDVSDWQKTQPDPTKITMPLLGMGDSVTFGRGDKLFELSNHLGNVLVTLNDKKLGVSSNNTSVDYFNPQVVSAQDYYPFGMLQPGRSVNVSGYRYGFNGKEKDDEVKGEGNSLDFGARIYDSRLGRWLSSDPAYTDYPGYTPYNFGLNNPIINLDNDGKRVYYCPGLGGRGANPDGTMANTGGSPYVQSVANAFTGSGVYFKELRGVNGNLGTNNLGFKHNPRLTDALFVAKYGQKPVPSLTTDHRIANAVAQIVEDITKNPLAPGEKVNLIGTSMGAVTTAQAALYILEHKEELGLSADVRIDNVILSGSTVNVKSKLYKRLEAALHKQSSGSGKLLSQTVDENGDNGYNYPEDEDGVTGLAGTNKIDMAFRFKRLVGQIIRGLQFGKKKNGKFGITGLDHPHTNAADNPKFGDQLSKQALQNDKIEGEKGAEGSKEYIKRQPRD
jgi:RHS repeat-associated protein